MEEKDNIQVGDRVTYKYFDNIINKIRKRTKLITENTKISYNQTEILKIERPKFEKVYEKKEILDEVEKEYLYNFLKPFKNRVETITKEENDEEQYLDIYIKDEGYFNLPNFTANTMYKGMKLGKEYTLKELGLE